MITKGMWARTAVLAAAAVLTTTGAAAAEEHAVVAVRSADELVAAVKQILIAGGQEEAAKQVDAQLEQMFGGKGVPGVDGKRPLGVFVTLPAEIGGMPAVVAAVPITDKAAFQGTLKQLNLMVGEPDGELVPVEAPDGKVFLRYAKDYVFGAQDPALLQGALPDPAALTAATKTNLIAAVFRLDRLPKEYRDPVREQFTKAVEEAKQEEKPGESPAKREGRIFAAKLASDSLLTSLEAGKELFVGFNLDPKTETLAAEVGFTANPGSAAAKTIAALAPSPSLLGPPSAEAALYMAGRIPVSAEIRDAFTKLFAAGFQEGLQKEADPKEREKIEKFAKEALPALATDVIDGGMIIRAAGQDGTYVVLMGAHVKDGKKLLSVVREMVKESPPKDGAEVKFDAAVYKGTALHHVKGKAKGGDGFEKMLGSAEGYLAFRDDAVLMTIGKHALPTIQDALDSLDRQNPPTAPMLFQIAFGKMAPLMEKDAEAWKKVAGTVFTGAAAGNDKIRIEFAGGEALKVRVEMSLTMIRAFAELDRIKKGQ
jgi:hypothetical protein